MRQASCQHMVTVQFPDLQARFRAPCEEAQAEEVSGTRKSPRESKATAQELDPWRMVVVVGGRLEFWNTPVGTAVLAWPLGAHLELLGSFPLVQNFL